MDRTIDFTNCKRAHINFGGSERKFPVVYNDDIYMLKFYENHVKKHEISTSNANNPISEYISSHIASSMGLPVHETVLGTYKDEIVVGCKDFRKELEINIEFSEYVHAKYDSKDIKRIIRLDQIYGSLKDPINDFSEELQKQSIKRYWDTFVIDALVGNFDRHTGNWGYLSSNNILKIAPIYDFGSTLFPQLSDQGCQEFINNQYALLERCLVFPSPSLVITEKKVGKVGYYDMLSSNYDTNCTKSVLDIVPKINMYRISNIIDETPYISDIRKAFYKKIIKFRKEIILDRAYTRCYFKDYDLGALNRLKDGHQFNVSDLKCFISERNQSEKRFEENNIILSSGTLSSNIKEENVFDKIKKTNEEYHKIILENKYID